MANEAGWINATPITLEESGASTANAAFSQANDADLTVANQTISGTHRYTHMDALLSTVDTSVNPTIGGTVDLFAMAIDIEGTADAPVPNVNYPHKYIGSFPIDDDAALTIAYLLTDLPLPFPGTITRFYIQNNCGQTISVGWNLRITPKSLGPAT